ncbi:MAG TPA: glycoside hydrolase family 35 protein [Candidatus Acidoferrales bacterium]|nr:glycoside hydrolase family 35 protein [Candidatus Acidoferrales bacterium]
MDQSTTTRQNHEASSILSRSLSIAFTLLLLSCSSRVVALPPQHHSIHVEGNRFMLDGKPIQIISGEMHYARIPRAYWRDRLRKARAMGLNTISTYVFWNLHEPTQGTYDFSGQLDVAEFIREAQQEGLYVILRPGPYVCSEWDLGGLPSWLLANPKIELRSNQEAFLQPAGEWLKRLGRELAPLQITRGGPIIAVQVENEYGSLGSDSAYMLRIRDLIEEAGFDGAILYTADGPAELREGTLPNLPAAVNFGPGYVEQAFAALRKFRLNGPLMSGEYWDGWFDHWGEVHNVTDGKQQAQDLDWMLSRGYSVNLYMFEGGASFGFMAGANYGNAYEPDTTSYDYDAPLDEAGRPTSKYFLLRDVILRHLNGAALPPVPNPIPVIEIPAFKLTESAPLWKSLGQPIESARPETMEEIGQAYGYILYRTRVDGPAKGNLVVNEVRDYATVFLDGRQVGTLDRRLNQSSISVDLPAGTSTLDILVENLGRINFGPQLREDRKGITQSVMLDGHELHGWKIYPLLMNDPDSLDFSKSVAAAPAFYRGTFHLNRTGYTFLDVSALGMGAAWVNGHNLGRFWNIGPQQTLYVPGIWLKKGKNDVIVFDIQDDSKITLVGRSQAILNRLK